MQKLTRELKKAFAASRRLAKIKEHIPKLDRQIAEKEREHAMLTNRALEEYEDIERLKKLGLFKLFNRLLGDYEQQLEKEKQEYLIAVINVQSVEAQIKALQYQKSILKSEVHKLKGIGKKLNTLLKRMEIGITATDSIEEKRIIGINQEILQINSYIGEINEAQIAGDKAKKYLNKLYEAIKLFGNWGIKVNLMVNRYHGKGRGSSYEKKMDVDRSKGYLFKCKGALDRFEYELEDVSKDLVIEFTDHMETIHDFLDIFLDNLITDWIVSKKLRTAITAIDMVYDKIVRLQQMLNHERQKRETAIKSLEQEKLELLLK